MNGSTILVQAPTVCAKDVVMHEVHQNDRSYICELSGLTFGALHKNFARWVVTWRTSKTTKLEGGTLAWDNTVRAWLETPPTHGNLNDVN